MPAARWPAYPPMMNRFLPTCLAAISLAGFPPQQRPESPASSGSYLGQGPPGTALALFGPGTVSTGLEEGVVTFMPDGEECYWSIQLSGFETIVTSRLENGRWTEPALAPFAGRYYDGWPAIQPDGKRMFFHSARPPVRGTPGTPATFNIWYVERAGSGWGEPKMVEGAVNGGGNATCPSVTRDGTLYLSKVIGENPERLCRARLVRGTYERLEVLPASVNASKDNFHGYIAPDESYLVRPLYGRPDAVGGGWNYYVAFRGPDDRWSELINLGKEVHTVRCAGAPSFSPDGKYLFLQGRIAAQPTTDLERTHSLGELLDRDIRRHANGSADIYWIDARIVEGLRPRGPIPSPPPPPDRGAALAGSPRAR